MTDETKQIAYVDRVDLAAGYVSLTTGHVCGICALLDRWGDDVGERKLKAVETVVFQLPSGEPYAFPLGGFRNPTVH